jgi:diguanylate cyclase (GGDEF)-like protein/PAS domain S-box-containing protein
MGYMQNILDELEINGQPGSFAELEMKSAALGVTVANVSHPDQPLIYANSTFLNITEYERSEVIGNNCRILQGGGTDQSSRHRIKSAIADGKPLNLTLLNYRRNGQEFWNSLSLIPARSRNSSDQFYVGLQFDASALVSEHRLWAFLGDATAGNPEDALQRLNFTDHVTGLLNRHAFFERLAERCNTSQGGILLVDIDAFRAVNDMHGHEVGDQVLSIVGRRIVRALRNGDIIARIAADQFAVLLRPGTSVTDESEVIAQRIARAISPPIVMQDCTCKIGCSIGIARFPDNGTGPSVIVRNAEMALHRAKNWGGGSVVMYESMFRKQQEERHKLALDLRQAIKDKQIEVHMQPQVRMSDGSLYGHEALARWPMPDGSWLPPGQFIPVAEDMGLIDMLGSYVVMRSFEFLRDYNAVAEKPTSIAINVSSDQMRDMAFSSWIVAEIERFGIDPKHVTLELTENILIDRMLDDIMMNIAEVSKAGVKIALDDFGTGWASLSHLQRFPIDYIKIDRSFVIKLEGGNDAICRAVIDMAKTLGKKVVAEGIETQGQLDALRALGCDYGQGYLFGKATPPSEVAAWYDAEIERVKSLFKAPEPV